MGFLKNVVKAVAAPFVAPVQAVASIASGGNVVDALTSGVVGTAAALNPVTQINTATGGALADAISKVPLVGNLASQNVSLGTQLSTEGGTVKDAAIYAGGQAAAAGAIAGGLALAPGIASAATAAGGSTSVAGAVTAAAGAAKALNSNREPSGELGAAVLAENPTAQKSSSLLPLILTAGAGLGLYLFLKRKK